GRPARRNGAARAGERLRREQARDGVHGTLLDAAAADHDRATVQLHRGRAVRALPAAEDRRAFRARRARDRARQSRRRARFLRRARSRRDLCPTAVARLRRRDFRSLLGTGVQPALGARDDAAHRRPFDRGTREPGLRACERGAPTARQRREAAGGARRSAVVSARGNAALDVRANAGGGRPGSRGLKVVLSIDPIRFPLTGIGRYTYELARALQQTGLESLQFLRRNRLQQALPMPDDAHPMATTPSWKRWVQKSRIAVFLARRLNAGLQGLALRGLEDHLFHGPNFYLPPFPGRSVVTIHDLCVYLLPHTQPPE